MPSELSRSPGGQQRPIEGTTVGSPVPTWLTGLLLSTVVLTPGSRDEVPAQPSLPPEAAQEGDLHLLWEALARKRRMSREPTLDSISELPEEDGRLQRLRQEAEDLAPDLSEDYSTADELARTGEADLSHTSSDDESRAGTPSLVTYLKKAGKPGTSPLASKVSLQPGLGVSDLYHSLSIHASSYPPIHHPQTHPFNKPLSIHPSSSIYPSISHPLIHSCIYHHQPSIHAPPFITI